MATRELQGCKVMMTASELADRLNARKVNAGWTARCPAHDDKNPSLSIGESNNGKLLMHCHAGCAYEDIVAAVGLNKSGHEATIKRTQPKITTQGKPTAVYNYTDEDGELLYKVLRYGDGDDKTFKYRRPDGKGGWIWNLGDVRKVPYNLPKVIATDTVFLMEGQKDCDASAAIGLVATNSKDVQNKKVTELYFTGKTVFIIPDNDKPGAKIAETAAQSLHGVAHSVKIIKLPDLPTGGDFSDFLKIKGAKEAERNIEKLMVEAPEWQLMDWPEPDSIITKVEAIPYPTTALPETIMGAVAEVEAFVQAPIPLIAASALSALSLAGQALIDVERAPKLSGPVSLNHIVIADSGERKTTVDHFFMSPIRNYETEQTERVAPQVKAYDIEAALWNSKCAGLLDAVKTATKQGKSTDALEIKLHTVQKEKPVPPRVPRLIYVDATQEALTKSLAGSWPSGGVISSEAGVVFGSHAMGKDSLMRTLSTYNILWDGTDMTIDRRKEGGSFTLQGARFTMGLQVQEGTLRAFFERGGGLARDIGYFARCLFAWPDSTQGQRLFNESAVQWSALEMFETRIGEILNMPTPINRDKGLEPIMLTLSPEAKAAWIIYHDTVEKELRASGELADVRDVASKAADNVARMAALFHLFVNGVTGTISPELIEASGCIVTWHLNEARRFFGELSLPIELINLGRLDSWILNYCRDEQTTAVPTRVLLRRGPGQLRKKVTLDPAIEELERLGRVRLVKEGRFKMIHVNPKLLEVLHETV